MSKPDTNVQVKKHILRTFVINPHFHICQKKKIALEIVAKIAGINGPLQMLNSYLTIDDYFLVLDMWRRLVSKQVSSTGSLL